VFATDKALHRLLGDWSERRHLLSTALMVIGVALLCMALSNPQWGLRRERVEAKAADIFIALDISTSMYARDVAPSRLERAKKFTIDLVQELRGERIGLILFAGNAYLQMPLTTDYAAAELFVRSAHPGLATTQGTAIGEAIDLALRAYLQDEGRHKGLIIITDGENHEDGALSSMEKARSAGLVPFIVSVGTTEGAFIPVTVQGRQDYKRDENGAPIRSAVNEELLRELANAGKGYVYSIFDAQFVLKDIREKIDLFEKREMEQRAFKDFESYYQYFLFGATVLLFAAWIVGVRRRSSHSSDRI
jgi:Ca-activated chloride channel family protein